MGAADIDNIGEGVLIDVEPESGTGVLFEVCVHDGSLGYELAYFPQKTSEQVNRQMLKGRSN